MKIVVFATTLGLAATAGVQAQNAIVPPTRLGLSLGAGLNVNDPSVQTWQAPFRAGLSPQLLPFINDSTRFTDGGTGIGLAIGAMVGLPITETIHFSGRIGYNGVNGSATATQRRNDTTVTHSSSASMGLLELTPAVEFYDLIDGVSIHPLVGVEFGIPISSNYEQSAELTVGSTTLNEDVIDSRAIPNTSLRAALLLGVGYTMKLTDKLYLQPEVSYRLPLTDVSSATAQTPWTVPQLRLGVNLFFDISSSKTSSTAAASGGGITVGMDRIVSMDREGREQPVSVINVEDVRYNEMFPIVPYLFFPEKNGVPDTALHRATMASEAGAFNIGSLPLDAVEINRNVLNVIGMRMKDYPQATLTITGTHDGKGEQGSKELARQRADFARTYLMTTFGIDGSRLTAVTGSTPARPSSGTDADGIAENRRVEFASNVPDILMPLVITADNQRVAEPDVLAFYPTVQSEDSLRGWTMRLSQAGRPLRDLQGTGRPTSMSWSIRPNDLSAAQVPVDWEFQATDVDGDSAIITGSIPVEYLSSVRKRTERLPDRTVDKYSLILFDFDKADLNAENQRILEQLVLPNIGVGSRVRIIGYTDRIGNDEYNRKLSKERAETVRAFLSQRAKDATYTASGVGRSAAIFPQEQPIGRQLSRTVQVIVETPRR